MSEPDKIHREDAPAWDGERFGQTLDTARLYVHIARDAPVAAVLRRGPNRHTALLKWDLTTDTITLGQWVNARIYERRCDISPDGKYFLYFAARHKAPLSSWTAVSILPWFRACVLWNKGDCWGGGGLFGDDRTIHLNHRPEPFRDGPDEFAICRGNQPRPWKSVVPFGRHSGWGEDEPINMQRLSRQGWSMDQSISKASYTRQGRYGWHTEGANVISKRGPGADLLSLIDDEHGEKNGRSYLTECQIVPKDGLEPRSFGRVDWADWHGSDLLFARNGCLWRLRDVNMKAPDLIADLNPMTFENIVAPYGEARRSVD